MRAPVQVEDIELSLLIAGVRARWGLCLDDRAPAALKRRVRAYAREAGCATIGELLGRVLRDEAWRDGLLDAVGRTDILLFRQASAWRAFRREVVPVLRTWPRLRLWVPACGGGEDVWSLAVVLAEEGLYERAWIYATDIAEPTLARARAGRWPGATLAHHARRHLDAGGTCPADTRGAPRPLRARGRGPTNLPEDPMIQVLLVGAGREAGPALVPLLAALSRTRGLLVLVAGHGDPHAEAEPSDGENALSAAPPEHGARPSVAALFESARDSRAVHVVAAVLLGDTGPDGDEAAATIRPIAPVLPWTSDTVAEDLAGALRMLLAEAA